MFVVVVWRRKMSLLSVKKFSFFLSHTSAEKTLRQKWYFFSFLLTWRIYSSSFIHEALKRREERERERSLLLLCLLLLLDCIRRQRVKEKEREREEKDARKVWKERRRRDGKEKRLNEMTTIQTTTTRVIFFLLPFLLLPFLLLLLPRWVRFKTRRERRRVMRRRRRKSRRTLARDAMIVRAIFIIYSVYVKSVFVVVFLWRVFVATRVFRLTCVFRNHQKRQKRRKKFFWRVGGVLGGAFSTQPHLSHTSITNHHLLVTSSWLLLDFFFSVT